MSKLTIPPDTRTRMKMLAALHDCASGGGPHNETDDVRWLAVRLSERADQRSNNGLIALPGDMQVKSGRESA